MPSTLLDAQQITRRYAARTVLDTVDVHLDAGSRVGLVGPNGAGKSTLLRILAGLEAPDHGTVRRLGTVGYLPQMADASEPRLSVRQLILERVGVAATSRELERWAATLQAGRLDAIELHAAALERWVALGGDDLDLVSPRSLPPPPPLLPPPPPPPPPPWWRLRRLSPGGATGRSGRSTSTWPMASGFWSPDQTAAASRRYWRRSPATSSQPTANVGKRRER